MSTLAPSTDERTPPEITGPHAEHDRYGRPTGVTYYRCEACRAEWVGAPDEILHADGCPHAR